MRIFLDANILFSAAKMDGAMRELLRLLRAGGHDLWADGYVLEEARRNLAAKAPEGLGALDVIVAEIHVAEAHPADAGQRFSAKLPEKDRPVLAAAVRLGCEALVTGDRKHFGALYGKTVAGVAIHSPRSLAEAVL
ncbi:MAG: PIN domain-containing protein [Betaproteobacteria bacterium]|nr:MAG: PIN domain-containing protein [Betaproteobacteria bacterium]